MSYSKKSWSKYRVIHTITCAYGTLGRCQHWFRAWSTLHTKKQRLCYGCGGSIFQDDSLCTMWRLWMHLMLLIYTLEKLLNFMAFRRQLHHIVIQNLCVIFGGLCGGNLGLPYSSVHLITHKQMGKLKLLIVAWDIYWGVWWARISDSEILLWPRLNLLIIGLQVKLQALAHLRWSMEGT